MLVKTDFEEAKLINTISILKELKRLMKSSNNLIIVNFPSQWYVDTLIDYMTKIPQKYIEDDYAFIIKDLQNEVNNSIKSIKFEDLSILIDKMKFATRGKNFYENVINLVLDMKMNKSAQNIVEKENLEIEIFFKYDDKKKEFKIYKPSQSAINLMVRPTPKKSLGIMVSGGISKKGLGNIIFHRGNVNTFSYKQVLDYYKAGCNNFKPKFFQ
jgi:hypothetical protein